MLTAPIAAQIDPVHINIGILAALKSAIAPILDMDVGFLVQFTDGLTASIMSSTRCTETPARYISTSDSFYTALTTTIACNGGCLKGNVFQAWHVECYISKGRCEITVIVSAAIALPCLVTLVSGGLCQLLSLGFQYLIQRLLNTASDQFF